MSVVLKEELKKIKDNEGFITPDRLCEKVIPFIVNNNLYRDENNKIIDVETFLRKILNTKAF